METPTQANLKMASSVDWALTDGKMAVSMKASLLKAKDKEKASGKDTMEIYFKANISKTSRTAGENLSGQTDRSTKASSETTSVTAKEPTDIQMARWVNLCGSTARSTIASTAKSNSSTAAENKNKQKSTKSKRHPNNWNE